MLIVAGYRLEEYKQEIYTTISRQESPSVHCNRSSTSSTAKSGRPRLQHLPTPETKVSYLPYPLAGERNAPTISSVVFSVTLFPITRQALNTPFSSSNSSDVSESETAFLKVPSLIFEADRSLSVVGREEVLVIVWMNSDRLLERSEELVLDGAESVVEKRSSSISSSSVVSPFRPFRSTRKRFDHYNMWENEDY